VKEARDVRARKWTFRAVDQQLKIGKTNSPPPLFVVVVVCCCCAKCDEPSKSSFSSSFCFCFFPFSFSVAAGIEIVLIGGDDGLTVRNAMSLALLSQRRFKKRRGTNLLCGFKSKKILLRTRVIIMHVLAGRRSWGDDEKAKEHRRE